MKKYLILALCVLAAVCMALTGEVRNLRTERQRLASNQEALMADVEYYKTKAGNSAASVQALTLTKSELKRQCEGLKQTVESLDIKLKRVQAAAQAATRTQIKVETVVRDSIVYRDTARVRLQAVKWQDPWVSVSGLIAPDRTAKLDIISVDTLTQVIHRVPKKWWFFRWGTKAIRQEIVSSNPHTRIVYSKYIDIR